MTVVLDHFLDTLSLGQPCHLGAVTLVPLVRAPDSSEVDATLLVDGAARVSELSGSAQVRRIRVESLIDQTLLLLGGEELQLSVQLQRVSGGGLFAIKPPPQPPGGLARLGPTQPQETQDLPGAGVRLPHPVEGPVGVL